MTDSRVKPERPLRAAIYLRVSSAGQVKTDYNPEGISLPAQRKACLQRAREVGALVVPEEYIEPGRSAKELEKRPVFQELRQRIKTKRDIDYVIVYAFNRAFRNAADRAIVTREFRKLGVRIIAANLALEDTPEAEMIEGILSYVDEYRIKADGKDIAFKMGEKIKNGGTASRAKIGYKNVRVVLDDGRKVADIVLDEDRALFITQMFDLYATGRYSYYDVQQIITERGLCAQQDQRWPGRRPVSIHSIGRILTDRYYCGYVTHEGKEYKGRHPALVSEDVFERVQQVITTERGGGSRNRVHKHHAKGRLFCGRCGKRLLIAKATGNGGTFFYYFCIGRQTKTCSLPYLPIADRVGVEAVISKHFAAVRLDTRFSAQIGEMVADTLRDEVQTDTLVRRELNRRAKELAAKEDALFDLVGDPAWPKDKLNARMAQVRREREGIDAQLADAQVTLEAGREVFSRGLDMLSQPDSVYDALQDEAARGALVKAVFGKLYLDADDDRHVTVTDHELATPFDALSAAQAAWQWTAVDRTLTDALDHAERQRVTMDKTRGRRPDGATASDENLVQLLASIFHDRGSSKANLVELQGLEPWTSSMPWKRSSQLSYSPTCCALDVRLKYTGRYTRAHREQ